MAIEIETGKFDRSIRACITNAKRLMEDAEWSMNRPSTGLALTLLAQEECAKAFVLALVREGILPWTDDVRRSLSVHACKHLVTMVMEWLLTINEQRLNEILTSATRATPAVRPGHLPPDVATAMNIYRHEMIERIGRRYPERESEWRGRARKLADGERDRRKQTALYVAIGEDGSLASEPPTSPEAFDEELVRTKALIDFAGDVDRKCIFARDEYELFVEIFKAMFADLASDLEDAAAVESFPSGIPGVNFVKTTITVANVVAAASDEPPDGSSNE